MKGYIQNSGTKACFVLQRQVPPGGRVQLEDAYKSVGKKSGVEETQTEEFVNFLKTQVLRKGSWSVFEAEGKPFGAPAEAAPKKAPALNKAVAPKTTVSKSKTSSKRGKDAAGAGRAMGRDYDEARGGTVTPSAIIEAPYDEARSLIEKTKDRVILKKALNLTKHFSGKEQHMRHIIKRLEQVY
jgi:hypothetical protein